MWWQKIQRYADEENMAHSVATRAWFSNTKTNRHARSILKLAVFNALITKN
jgi:hypothetical protein